MKPLLLISLFFLSFEVNSQTLFYQDVFRGGVTGDGYTSFNLAHSDTLHLHYAPNSIIRKALLFVNLDYKINASIVERSFKLNDYLLTPNVHESLETFSFNTIGVDLNGESHFVDVTNMLSVSVKRQTNQQYDNEIFAA